MSTTTIRLPEDLKARVAQAAEAAGTTSHNFILEAIAEKADLAERRADFHAQADQRWAEFLETGESISWEEMRRWVMPWGLQWKRGRAAAGCPLPVH